MIYYKDKDLKKKKKKNNITLYNLKKKKKIGARTTRLQISTLNEKVKTL